MSPWMRMVATVAVVGLVIVLSCGMLLPRLMRGREDAGRVYCMNNLRVLFLALDQYHQRHDAFPRAVLPARGLRPEDRVSWLAAVAPFLNEKGLPVDLDPQQGWAAEANRKARETAVARFRCPSVVDPRPAKERTDTHYPGMAGLGPDAARLPLDHPRAGCFGYWRDVTVDYIRAWDGTSATILILETAREPGPWLAGGPPTARGLDPARQPYLGPDGQFGGTHPAGTQALYADGSAKLHTAATSPRILEALVTLGGTDAEPEQ